MLINKEFVKGFSRLYSSHLDTSLKLVFEFYDFDEDGFITKEDIRIILSYVPICEIENKKNSKEGKFTSGLGAVTSFKDRKEAQHEIQELLTHLQEKIDYDEFKKFNQEVTSETLLCILTTLRNSLPCTNNFYLYLRNYQKVLEKGSLASTAADDKKEQLRTPQLKSSPLASPTLGKKFLATSLLVSEKMKKRDVFKKKMPGKAQNPLLKYALGNTNGTNEDEGNELGKPVIDKSNLISAQKYREEREKRKLEISKLEEDVLSIDYTAVRMPNKKDLGKKEEEKKYQLIVEPAEKHEENILMSPTSFLQGGKKPRKDTGLL